MINPVYLKAISLMMVFPFFMGCDCDCEQENFVSSVEGRISKVVLFEKADIIGVAQETTASFCNVGLGVTNECNPGGRFCSDYLKSLSAEFPSVTVMYHFGSAERINQYDKSLIKGQLGDYSDKLNELEVNFGELVDELPPGLIETDFQDYMDYQKLISGNYDSFNFVGDSSATDKAVISLLDEIRKTALDWRNERRLQLTANKDDLVRECEELDSVTINYEINVSYIDELCSAQSDFCECLDEAKGYLSAFPQDQLLVQNCRGSSVVRHQFNSDKITSKTFNLLTKDIAVKSGVDSDTISRLAFEGGNCLFTSKVNLVGRETLLKNYLDLDEKQTWKNLNAIGLSQRDTINEFTVTSRIESITGRPIIWVGTNYARETYSSESSNRFITQPLWHIDMFIAPIRFIQSESGKDTLYYMLSKPDSLSLDIYSPNTITRDPLVIDSIKMKSESLADWIDITANKLDRDLFNNGIIGVRKIVSLPLKWWYGQQVIYQYYSYSNGLAEQSQDQVTYHMPIYCEGQKKRANTVAGIKRELEATIPNFEVKYVPWTYDKSGGLHCHVVVLERDNQ